MKCARCSAEVPKQSQFCLRCGTPINTAANYAPPLAQPNPMAARPLTPAPSNQRPLYAIIGLLTVAVLALVGWMVKSSLAQKPGETRTTSMIQAPAVTAPLPLIQAPGETRPQTPIVAPPTQPVQQPDYTDINDYLKFVQQVERTKQQLIKREIAEALVTMTKTTSEQVPIAEGNGDEKAYLPNINAKNQNYAEEWEKLTRIFIDHRPLPPQSCVQLHDKYYNHLSKSATLLNKIHDAMAQASSGQSTDAVSALTSLMGNTDAETSAQSADDELDNICHTYKLEKTFKIQAESGSGGSLLH